MIVKDFILTNLCYTFGCNIIYKEWLDEECNVK
jgi:hypothetical protein